MDPKMTAMEKLFIQIFERKNRIIDQLKQQTELYDQHLASKLLIEGVTPPPWLWDPKPFSNLTDPPELNKEEMISKILFPHPNHVFPCSSGLNSLHNRLVVNGGNILLPELPSSKAHDPQKSLGNIQHEFGFAPVLDMSPQEKINLINPDSCMWADKSLVQVQRSKSRQRALELRSASKIAAGKIFTSQEKDIELQEKILSLKRSTPMPYSGRVTRSRFSHDLLDHAKESVELKDSLMISKKGDNQRVDSASVCPGKDIFEHISSSYLEVNKSSELGFGPVLDMSPQEKINLSNPDSCNRADKSLVQVQRSKSRQRALEHRSASKIEADKSSTSQEKDSELQVKFLSLKKSTSMEYSGRVTRSKFSHDLLNHAEESVELKDSFKISNKGDYQRVDSASVCLGKDIFEHISSSDLEVNKRRKLGSSASEKSPIANEAMENEYQKLSSAQINSSIVSKYGFDEENQNADFVVYEPCQHQANDSNFELNSNVPVVASENPGLKVPSDCGINTKPKALNSSDVGGLYVDKESLDTLVARICSSTEKPSESLEITRFDNCDTCPLEGRSLELEVSNKVDEFRESISKSHVEVHAEPGMEKCKSGMQENLASTVSGMCVSVPNMQHPPSDGIKSVSTNDGLDKIASPLLGKEKLDMVVDKINILLETDNRSPEQSNYDNPTTLHLWVQPSEAKCHSSGSKAPNEVDDFVSVPNIQSPPSDGIKSVSTNDVFGKIASPLLGKENLDTAVDKHNILLETGNRSPGQSNFDNPKTLHLWGQSSEPKCQSSRSKVPNEVDGMSVSVPNIHPPSDWIKSVSTNDIWAKIASPLLEMEKVDTAVDKSSILLETDKRSSVPSNFDNAKTLYPKGKSSESKGQSSDSKVPNEVDEFQQGFSNTHVKVFVRPYVDDCESDKNTPGSNIVHISATDPISQQFPASCGENRMVVEDVHDLKRPQSLKTHLTEGYNSSPKVQSDEGENGQHRKNKRKIIPLTFQDMENSSSLSSLTIQPAGDQNPLCGEMRLEAPNSDTFSYKGGCCDEKQIMSPQQDDLSKRMTHPFSREIIMQENFNLPESGSLDCGLVNGKDDYFVPSSSQVEEFDKSCSSRGVMLTNTQLKRRKTEGEKKKPLSASTNVLEKTILNVTQDPVNVETSLEVSSQCQSLHVSLDGETTHVELDGNPEVELHHKMICHLTVGSELSPVLKDGIGTKEGDTDTDSPSVIRMDFLGDSKLNKQSYSDSKHAASSCEEIEAPASFTFDVRNSFNMDAGSVPYMEHVTNVDNNSNLTYLDGPLQELEDPLEEYGLQPSSSAAYTEKKDPESGADCMMPGFEGFTFDSETQNDLLHLDGDMTSFDDMDLQTTMIERASFLEQLCISSSMCTPVPQSSTAFMLPETPDLYKSVPNGLLEQMNFGSPLLEIDEQNRVSHSCTREGKHKNQEPAFSHCLLFSDSQFGWSSKRRCLPSVGNLWDHMDLIPSKSSSSEKRWSSNPEHTCYRIEEDAGDHSEESENAEETSKQFQENSISELVNSDYKREALAEMEESQIHGSVQIAAAEDRCRDINSLCSEPTFTGNQKMARQNPANRYSQRHPSEGKEKHTLSIEINRKKIAESSNNRFSKPKLSSKGSERQGGHRPIEKQSKHKNIVSNITSFIPLVQQKQAAAVCTGKRDVKVRALETAEAAKRLEEKKKNERNMKKEALKLERERLARENLKQTELLKKKKEEELKKKDADIAARKRQKEEEEKRAKERKRKRFEQTRQQLEEHEVKLHAKKREREIRPTTTDVKTNNRESSDRLPEHQKMEKCRVDHESLCETFDAPGVMGDSVRATRSDMKPPEKSYDISPYHNSENEEDEDEDAAHMKFTPAWASKNSEDIALFFKNKIDPDVVFPPKSFPTTSQVNLGRWTRI